MNTFVLDIEAADMLANTLTIGLTVAVIVPLLRTNSTSNAFTLNHLCMDHARAEEGIREFTH